MKDPTVKSLISNGRTELNTEIFSGITSNIFESGCITEWEREGER